MMTRNDLYQQFGPLLIEAIVLIIKDEINIIRTDLGLPKRTNEQILTIIGNKLSLLSKYAWMDEQD